MPGVPAQSASQDAREGALHGGGCGLLEGPLDDLLGMLTERVGLMLVSRGDCILRFVLLGDGGLPDGV